MPVVIIEAELQSNILGVKSRYRFVALDGIHGFFVLEYSEYKDAMGKDPWYKCNNVNEQWAVKAIGQKVLSEIKKESGDE